MAAKPKTSNLTYVLIIIVVMLAISIFVSLTKGGQLTGFGGIYSEWNTSISQATIGNVAPVVGGVLVIDYPNEAGNLDQITLYGGATKLVNCSGIISDNNGWNDTGTINATFYEDTIGPGWTQNDTSRYANTNCTKVQLNSTAVSASCLMNVWYNADNTTNTTGWTCMMYANDTANYVSNASDAVAILTLTAINVDPVLDFSSLALGAISAADVNHTIYNYGNVRIDLKLNGTDLACTSPSIQNISVGNMHYNCTDYGQDYTTEMAALTGTSYDGNCTGFDLVKSTDASGTPNATTKELPWKIQIPSSGVAGTCNGTIWFVGELG